jgi:dimethylargininase
MFKNAIVKTPAKSIVNGLSCTNLGIPNYKNALEQHRAYIKALESCGLAVLVLDADEAYPDSTFIEDIALLTPHCAIITRPGAPSRVGETSSLKYILRDFYTDIEEVHSPGTVEAGDIMMVGSHFYIGISQRTNLKGGQQIIKFLEKYGMTGSLINLKRFLHLKTGLSYIENNNLVAAGEFLVNYEFQKFNVFPINDEDTDAANCIWVNGNVLIPQGYPKINKVIQDAGYTIISLDVSEFQKLDGGLSCLSLRF